MRANERRIGRWAVLLIGALAVGGCGTAPVAIPTARPHPTPVSACTAVLGSGWRVAVQQDRGDVSTLALISGDSIGTCQTTSSGPGTDYDNTSVGVGLHPARRPPVLAYLTGGGHGDETSYLVGRVPPPATAVRIAFGDGSTGDAVLGNGVWLVWLDEPTKARVTTIEALDASGNVVSRLADADGVQPTD